VSSPGIDRPLRTPEHFSRFIGEKAIVKTTGPIDGRSSFSGIIETATDDYVTMACDDVTYEIPFAQVKKANLKGTVSF
jgi:ribosome maturation factor RimP